MFTPVITEESPQKICNNNESSLSLHVKSNKQPKYLNMGNGTIESPNTHYALIATRK